MILIQVEQNGEKGFKLIGLFELCNPCRHVVCRPTIMYWFALVCI